MILMNVFSEEESFCECLSVFVKIKIFNVTTQLGNSLVVMTMTDGVNPGRSPGSTQ